MLISAVVVLAILGTDGAFVPVKNTDVAVQRQDINAVQYDVEARTAAVDRQSTVRALNWTCPMNESDDPSGIWYRFLNSFYCEFSTYERQRDKKSYNVANLRNWANLHLPNLWKKPMYTTEAWKSNTGEGIHINERNFGEFLETIKPYGIAEQDNIKTMEMTDAQLNELNHVLDITIKDKLDISCVESSMYVTGNNILFSHIGLSISAGTVDESCRVLLDTDQLKHMNIFALNTVFIDDEIQKKFDLITIIAPKWEIKNGKRTIDLNGKNGEIIDQLSVLPLGSASEPLSKDGKPGNDGEHGRNFFGIGVDFIGGENLNIYANGGDGSGGEDGADGDSGRDGTSPTKPSSSFLCKKDLCKDDKKINLFKCEEIECKKRYIVINSPNAQMPPPNGQMMMVEVFAGCLYRMHGEEGSRGRDGGDGGNGGEGGSPGDIELLELNGRSGITQSKNPGSNGLGGKGGIGGLGGKTGNDIDVECDTSNNWEMLMTVFSNKRAASGGNGLDGRTRQTPNQATPIPNRLKAKTINQYKTFLRANINDPFRNNFLMNFLNRLENNPDVKNVYDILGFIDELKSLEGQFHNLYRYVNFYPFYKSLLDRISDYATSVSDKNDKKVLAYLYTATLGRTNNLDDDLESNLISDVTTYLDIVKQDIEKLKQWQNGKLKEDITNEYKQKYKAEIDKKIKDANALISKEIVPEMHKIEAEIDKQIEKLTDEVINLQNEARVNETKLREKKRDLENELVLQGIFGCLKVLSTVVSFMGPIGAVAGSVIDIGSGLAENLLIDVPSDSDNVGKNLKQTASDLASLKKNINAFNNKTANELKKKVDTVIEEVDKQPDVFERLSVNVRVIQDRMTTIKSDKITIKEVQEMEINLTAALQEQKQEIKAKEDKEGSNEKTKKGIEVIDHLEKVFKVGSVMIDTYNKYKKSKGKIAEVEKAIEQNAKKFDALKEYESKIYNTMGPMLESMKKNLDNIINQIKDKSKVELDVTRWKVKSTLKDMMSYMKQFTANFKVQGSLVRCIDKLQDGMDALMNVQDHIEDYQNDQILANFIAGVSSISVNDLDVSYNLMPRSNLSDALQELEIITTASIVMQRHRVAIDAFKQFVFPFADKYFKDSLLPSHLELDNKNNPKLDDVITRAITHIHQITSKLREYKASINKIDQCSGVGKFISNVTSTEPFFVWENNDNSDMILRLLSGEEVIVTADIMKSHFIEMYDAIKFNSIQFGFNAKDKNIQDEIENILKEFKVTGTHLGNSYYRYQDNTYLISTGDLKIWYSFEKIEEQPSQYNDAYDKLKEGDFMLSPYATWKIKLDHLGVSRKYSFESLKTYKDVVDLMLEGKGHYVVKGEENCVDHEVNKYYKPINEQNTDDSTLQSNAIDFVALFSYKK